MNILGTIFGGKTQIDHKLLRYGCIDRKFLPTYLSDISNYQCALNRGLLQEAMIDEKGHRFCKVCIQSYLEQTKYCPVDVNNKHKIKKQSKDSLRQDKESRMIVDNLQCRCENFSNGCQYIFTIKDFFKYKQHKNLCPKEYIKCTENGCSAAFYRQDFQKHLEDNCGFVVIKCQYCDFISPRHQHKNHRQVCKEWPLRCTNNGCGNDIRRKLFNQHVKSYCPHAQVVCIKNRCGKKFKRNQQNLHNVQCEYVDQVCEHCKLTYQKFDKISHLEDCTDFPLSCKNKECVQIVPRKFWKKHVDQLCPYKQIFCPSEDCELKLLNKQLNEHLKTCQFLRLKCQYCPNVIRRKDIPVHLQTCVNFPIQCKNLDQCTTTVLRGLRQLHIQKQCGFATINCKYLDNYCPYTCLRKNMPEHEAACQYRPEPCRLCRKVMPLITIQAHIDAQCIQHTVKCGQDCPAQVKRKEMSDHYKTDCAETLVVCEYLEYNCTHRFKRKMTEEHQQKFLKHHHTLILKLTFGLKEEVKNLHKNQQKLENQITQLRNLSCTNNFVVNQVLDLQKNLYNNVNMLSAKAQRILQEEIQISEENRKRGKQLDRIQDLNIAEKRQIIGVQAKLNDINKSVRDCDNSLTTCRNQIQGVRSQVDKILKKMPISWN